MTSTEIFLLTGSERREYLPIGFIDNNTVLSNGVIVIYDSEIWIFGLISSRIHLVWVKSIGGQLETRIRYSPALC